MSFDALEFWTLIWGAATALVATSAAFGSEEPEEEDAKESQDLSTDETGGELDDKSPYNNIYELLTNPDEFFRSKLLDNAKKIEPRGGDCLLVDDQFLYFPFESELGYDRICEAPTELAVADDSRFDFDDPDESEDAKPIDDAPLVELEDEGEKTLEIERERKAARLIELLKSPAKREVFFALDNPKTSGLLAHLSEDPESARLLVDLDDPEIDRLLAKFEALALKADGSRASSSSAGLDALFASDPNLGVVSSSSISYDNPFAEVRANSPSQRAEKSSSELIATEPDPRVLPNNLDEPKYLLGPNGEYRLVEGTETLERYVIDESGQFVPQVVNRQEIPFLPAKIFFRSPNRDGSNGERAKKREDSRSDVAAASESGFFGIDSAAISDSVGFDDISEISDPGASSLGGFSSLEAPTNVAVPPPPSVGSRKEVAGASVETFWAPVETSDSPDDEEEDDDFPSETASNPFANAESSPESASNPFETSSSSVPFSSSPSEPRAPSETKYSDFLSSSVDTEPSKKVQNKSRTASTPRFSDSLSSSVDIEPPTSAKKEPQNRKSSDDSRTARAPQLPPREETDSEPDKPFEPGNPFEVDTFEDSSVSFIFHSSEVPEDE